MAAITPEQRHEVERAGREPVRLTDPETNDTYYLLKEEVYDRIRDVIAPGPEPEVPEGIRLAQEAFFRDLPGMLADPRLKGRWVAYHRGERIAVGRRERDVLREVARRDISDDEYCTFVVREQWPEPEQAELTSPWL